MFVNFWVGVTVEIKFTPNIVKYCHFYRKAGGIR